MVDIFCLRRAVVDSDVEILMERVALRREMESPLPLQWRIRTLSIKKYGCAVVSLEVVAMR